MVKPPTGRPVQALRGRKVFYGWWIALTGLVSNFYSSGTFYYGFGAFFNPLVDTFGWTRAATSAAFSIQQAESGAIAPFVGYFVDRFGPRRVMTAGIIVTGLGFMALAAIQSLWQFYLAFLVIAIGSSFGGFIVVVTTLNNWFVAKRGRAMAIMTTGAGLAGTLAPLLVFLIDTFSWRWALVAVGVGTWAVGIPTSMAMRRRPEDYGLLPDGDQPQSAATSESSRAARPSTRHARIPEGQFSVREALHSNSFWLFALAFSISSLASSTLMVHLIPAETNVGISRERAALAVTLLTLLSLLGRWTGGIAGDYVDRRFVLAASVVLQVLGILLLAVATSFWHFVVGLLLFSPGFGASVPTRWALLADYFGRRSFGSLMGILMTVSVVFGVFSPIFAGWMFDVRQSYRLAFILLAFMSLPALPLYLMLKRPTRAPSPSTTAATPTPPLS
ncbi:MAG: MFS transporter [Chloroflexota bacterium]|nr:MFS transporter [Chloroflexota bacterium]